MTKFKNILVNSLKNIVNNKLRSLLTILGLVIGIASVIVLVGIGNGTSGRISSQVQSLGTDILTIKINSSDNYLEYSNISEIKTIDNVDKVAPYKTVSSTISRGTTSSTKASLVATTPEYLDALGLSISSGRIITEIDLENYSKVCLIGSDMAEELFSLSNPVGQSIKIDGDNYTVIGVLTTMGSSLGNNIDESTVIPFTTAKYLGSDTSISNLYVKVSDDSKIDTTTTLLEYYIQNKLGISTDYFSVSSQDSMLSTMDDINNTLSILLGGIASISLVVAGIGVMNVMLVSVTERTKEIGIRKALGAKRIDILLQFLIEALVLCIIGGLIGILFGMGIGTLLGKMGHTFSPSISIVLVAFLSSGLIGTIFGIFPANKASKLNPIEALHTE